MKKRFYGLSMIAAVVGVTGVAVAQGHPIVDRVADKVIAKYQGSTCEQLWLKKGQPKSEQEQRVVNFLRTDPQLRREFIDKIAGPVANKMFECGMIP
jgi:hypothetical protein